MGQMNVLQPPVQRRAPGRRGYTLLEIVLVLSILGILVMAFFPTFTHSSEIRLLDNAANQILMAMQTAKWQAADTSLKHRVRFSSSNNVWTYRVEREATSGNWVLAAGTVLTQISTTFEVTVNLPATKDVIFETTGFVSNYDGSKNTITLASPKLRALNQPYQRIVRLFAGGGVQCAKS